MRLYSPTGERRDEPDLSREELLDLVQAGFVPSVTEVLNVLHEEHLTRWHIKNSLKHLQQHGDFEAALAYRDTTASDFGSVCHRLCELFLLGQGLDDQEHERHHYEAVQPFLRWCERYVEQVIFCERFFADTARGYGGTVDMLIKLKSGKLVLSDLKFKKNSKKFPMHSTLANRYQLSAYRAHFKEVYGEMEIANFLLASPLGYDPTPTLKVVPYLRQDWMQGFYACLHIWKEKNGLL